MKKMLSCIVALSIVVATGMLASCNSKPTADLVVYGKIFTADSSKIADLTDYLSHTDLTDLAALPLFPSRTYAGRICEITA